MSTKRLSRTIIERGKRGSDKEERKQQIIKSRRKARNFCTTYCEDSVEPFYKARHYYREFGDRLSALDSFLKAHIGQPWDKIYSKLCAIRSRKTIQGHHFIQHAKDFVFSSTGAGRDIKWTWGYYIEDGILLYDKYKPLRYPRLRRDILKRYEDWIGNRKIKLIGSKYFWYDPVKSTVIYLDGVRRTYVSAWRQGIAMNEEEIGYMIWLKRHSPTTWEKILGYQ